jgi:hypothetical protein
MFYQDANAYRAQALKLVPVTRVKPLPKMVRGSIPPDIKLRQNQLAEEITRDRMLLDRGTEQVMDEKGKKMVERPLDPRRKLALARGIEEKQKQAMELIAPGGFLKPEYNQNVDQTSFNRARWDAADIPVPPVPAADPTRQAPTTFTNPGGGSIQVQKGGAVPVEEAIMITTKEQFDKLPPGAVYTGKDGKKRRKP